MGIQFEFFGFSHNFRKGKWLYVVENGVVNSYGKWILLTPITNCYAECREILSKMPMAARLAIMAVAP
jgi:hypothetical protein